MLADVVFGYVVLFFNLFFTLVQILLVQLIFSLDVFLVTDYTLCVHLFGVRLYSADTCDIIGGTHTVVFFLVFQPIATVFGHILV